MTCKGESNMQIRIDTDYAIRCILYLAQKDGRAQVHDLIYRMSIPKEKIGTVLNHLMDAGLIEQHKEDADCIVLKRSIRNIRLQDIYNAMGEVSIINPCQEPGGYCDRNATATCLVRKYYGEIQDVLDSSFAITIEELLNNRKCDRIDYYDMLDELVYIVDMETEEILYMNKKAKEIYQIQNYEGYKCYDVFYGLENTCQECENAFLQVEKQERKEVFNKKLGRYFSIDRKAISFHGRLARLEIATDISESMKMMQELSDGLVIEKMISECVSRLQSAQSYQEAMDYVTEKIGSFSGSSATFIYEKTGNGFTKRSEWNREKSDINIMPGILKHWMKKIRSGKMMEILDLHSAELSPEEVTYLTEGKVDRCFVMPFMADGELVGCGGLLNAGMKTDSRVEDLYTTVGYSIAATIALERKKKFLEKLSFMDTMTDVGNRNAYLYYLDRLRITGMESLGLAFIDINHLKETNDAEGHEKGDELIRNTAALLASVFQKEEIFRIGGDEFIVLVKNVSEEHFRDQIANLRTRKEKEKYQLFAIGSAWEAIDLDIDRMIKKADFLMYQDKKRIE